MKSTIHNIAFLGAAFLGASCQLIGGFEPTDDGGFQVRGEAAGILEPVQLELEVTGRPTQTLTVDTDGDIAFPGVLGDGESYTVRVPADRECALENEAGTIAGANPQIGLFCAGVTRLSGLAITTPAGIDLGFEPERTAYAVDVGLLQQLLRITPTTAFDDVLIAIGGVEVSSGEQSAPVPVAVGDTSVDITVRHRVGLMATYRIDVARSPTLRQDTYAKSSAPASGFYDASDAFGFSVAADRDVVAIGAPFQAESDRGAVFVFRRNGAAWAQEAMLQGPGVSFEAFGISVAVSGDILAVGASGGGAGAVFVFEFDGARWNQIQVVTPTNPDDADSFGRAVALGGTTLAVGAPLEDSAARGVNGNSADDTATNAGAAYVFERAGGAFVEQAYIKPLNTDAGDQFGAALALSGDALVIGARLEDAAGTNDNDNSAVSAGAAYVFRRMGESWLQEAYLKASNVEAGDNFGHAVTIDGELVAVTARLESSAATGVGGAQNDNNAKEAGATYVFVHEGGPTWRQEAYVKASNTEDSDNFGTAVSLLGDVLVVTATGEDSLATGIGGNQLDNSRASSGAVYVYTRRDAAWSQQAYVKASNTDANDFFGSTVVLTPGEMFVGATGEASGSPGVNGDQSDNSQFGSGASYFFQ